MAHKTFLLSLTSAGILAQDRPEPSAATAARVGRAAYQGVATSALAVAFLYAVVVIFHGSVPTLNSFSGMRAGVAGVSIDVALLALVVAHFHWVQRPWLVGGVPREALTRQSGAQSRLLAAALMLGFFFAWQPLPQLVWSVSEVGTRAALWTGLAVGCVVQVASMALMDRHPSLRFSAVVGLVLIEWCAPDMSLGHLLFATGITGYLAVVGYHGAFPRPEGFIVLRIRGS
jgi:methanethiol S-methyltransferase